MARFPFLSYLVLGSYSFPLCQEDENTAEKSRFVTVELSCGRTAAGTFMFYSQFKVDGGCSFCVQFLGGAALS